MARDTGVMHRLGAYLLPGRIIDPQRAIGEAKTAEHLGLRTVWLGERLGNKDFGPVLGAVGQATRSVHIGSGVTNIGLRHPISLASTAMTLQALTQGRFLMGLGRLHPSAARAYGLPSVDNAVVADTADILRKLCRGDRVSYRGPAGDYPRLRLTELPDLPPPPLILAAIGPQSLRLAGQHYDGVFLHPFLTPEAVERSAQTVRTAAEQSGRNPADIRIYATVVVAPELPPDEELAVVAARAVTYFQIEGYGENLARVNGWDPAPLGTLRSHPMLSSVSGAADHRFTRDQLLDVARQCIPTQWIDTAAAVGSAARCSSRLNDYLAAGADELVIHGSTTELLGPLLEHMTRA
jgi:5,10-methylenetetrahydromethanopterin reductase